MNQAVENALGSGESSSEPIGAMAGPVPVDRRFAVIKAIAYYQHEQLSPFTEAKEPETWMFAQGEEIMAMLDASNQEAIRFAKEKAREQGKVLEVTCDA